MWLLTGWTWKLKPLGSRLTMPKNIHGHWSRQVLHCIQPLLALNFICKVLLFESKYLKLNLFLTCTHLTKYRFNIEGHGIQNCYKLNIGRLWNSIFFVPITVHQFSYCCTSHTIEEEISTKMSHTWERIEQYSRGAYSWSRPHRQFIAYCNFNQARINSGMTHVPVLSVEVGRNEQLW